jgi:hypothetical protein
MEPVMTDRSTESARRADWDDRSCCRGGSGSRLWVGLLLIGIGTLFALATYGVVDFHFLRLVWPLVLIVVGAGLLARSRGRRVGGLIVLLLGIGFLARNSGVLPFDERLLPAGILMVVGVGLAISSLVPRRRLPGTPR